jgi:hypothetical protein
MKNPWMARFGLCAAVCIFVASMAVLLMQGTHSDQMSMPTLQPAQIQSAQHSALSDLK